MFASFGRSIELAKASFAVLRSDKELLLFPLVSFIALVVGSIALVGAAVSGIFVASLYRYATRGDAGQLYRPGTMAAAFRTRS